MSTSEIPVKSDRERLRGVRMSFKTLDFGDSDYHVRSLRDVQQCPASVADVERYGVSSATWPLFGVLWSSEELLAHLMVDEEFGTKKILEIGCGLALASLVLKRRGADITTTDQNPEVSHFLDFNTDLNELDQIAFRRATWQDAETSLGQFDLVVGSDLLYDRHNLAPLVSFLDSHVAPDGQIVIVDPRRGMTSKFTRLLQDLGFQVQTTAEAYASSDGVTSDYWVMRFSRAA